MKLYIPVLLIVSLLGCTKLSTDFEFKNKDPKIVIQAKFQADTTANVFLTRSLDMYDKRTVKTISGAVLNVYRNNELIDKPQEDSAGWYSIDASKLIAGNTYRIEAVKEGFPTATSDFYLPIQPEILRVDTSTYEENRTTDYFYGSRLKGRISVHFRDNPQTDDYYQVSIKRLVEDYKFNEYGEILDTFYYNQNIDISSQSPYAAFLYNGNFGEWMYADNDAWGITRILFTDRLFNGSADATLSIDFEQQYYGYQIYEEDPSELVVLHFSSVDEQYYKFARAKAEMYEADGNPLSEPVTPYNSVIDGYGLVYGINTQTVIVDITGLFEQNYDYYY